MKNLLVTLFTFTMLCATAQDYKLVYYKGEVSVAGQKLAINVAVNNDATVKIGNSSEAIFTNSKKEVVHLNKTGTYLVRNFAWYMVKDDKTSLSGYYLKYVANQATHHEADPEKNANENLKNVGGVSRGRRPFLNFPIVETKLLTTTITFNWPGDENQKYQWILMEQLGDSASVSVTEGQASGNLFTLDLAKEGCRNGHSYSWMLSNSDSKAGGSAAFYLPTAQDQKKLWEVLDMLPKTNDSIPKDLQNAIMVNIFAEQGYYLDADAGFRKAIAKTPDSEYLKELYSTFRKNIYGE